MSQIAICCDLSLKNGLGHFIRCLNLYNELKKKKRVYFLFTSEQIKIIKKINIKNIVIKKIKKFNFKEIKKKILNTRTNCLIFDSYKLTLKKKNFFKKKITTVAIDDHLKNYETDLVFSSRYTCHNRNISGEQKIYSGFNYVLLNQKKNKKKISKKKFFKILIHAGGMKNYKLFYNFLRHTLNFLLEKKDCQITILAKKNFFNENKSINLLLNKNKKIIFIDYINNLKKVLKNYDIVCGPLGMTTYETLLSQSLPITFSIQKDSKYYFQDWVKNGHILHLKYFEKNKKKLVDDVWSFAILNYRKIFYLMKKNISFRGDGAKKVAKIILNFNKEKYYKNILIKKFNKVRKNFFKVKKCTLEDSYFFLKARNLKINRLASAQTNRKINWIEHIQWWSNKNIVKYKVLLGEKIVSYFWIKSFFDNNSLTSGWFLTKKKDNKIENLKISNFTVQSKINIVKQNFKKKNWLIVTKKSNKMAGFINKKNGLKNASKKSKKEAVRLFKITKINQYDFMELKV